MTDPLLTIEDATREFRVSPKTIRRRLSSGEIDGAYKRPGSRGPEWVMPRESLAAAGFVPRPLAEPAALPSDVDERAAYWERRALDAEAALGAAEHAPLSAPRQDRRALGWFAVAVGLVIALVAVLIVRSLDDDRGDAAPVPEAAGTGAMPLVVELLGRETDPGDAIGVVGARGTDALPTGRVVETPPQSGWGSASEPRFVVATFDDEAPPPPVQALRASSEVVLRAPHAGMVVEVYDRRSPVEGDPSEVAGAPQRDADPALGSQVMPRPAPPDGSAVANPVETSEVQVEAGESFWSIAERLVTAERGVEVTEATVTAYWSALVEANADRLVEPGNPGLLHVGQMIVLPPVT